MLLTVQGFTGSPSLLCWPHTRVQLLTASKRTAEVLQPAQLQADRMLYGRKKVPHVDLPLYTSREEEARKGSWSCHICAWHRQEPQSWPWSWSSSHSTQHCRYHCGHAAGRILGLWEAERQERIAGSSKKFSQKQLALGAQDAQEIRLLPSLLTQEPD